MFGEQNLIGLGVFILALLPAIVLHEIMHAIIAYKLGDDLAHSDGRISFNPLNHIDPFLTIILPVVTFMLAGVPILAAKPVPINTSRIKGDEYGFALVALAGPLTNVLLALGAGLSLRFIGFDSLIADFMVVFLYLNVGLAAFNLLPLPPLDGSRVLYCLVPESIKSIMRNFERLGMAGFIIVILFFGKFFTPLVSVVAGAILKLVSIVVGIDLAVY